MRSSARFTVDRSMCDVLVLGASGSGGIPSDRAAPAGAGANAAPVAAGTATAGATALPAAAGAAALALSLPLGADLAVLFVVVLVALDLALAASATLPGRASAAAMTRVVSRLIRSLVIDRCLGLGSAVDRFPAIAPPIAGFRPNLVVCAPPVPNSPRGFTDSAGECGQAGLSPAATTRYLQGCREHPRNPLPRIVP